MIPRNDIIHQALFIDNCFLILKILILVLNLKLAVKIFFKHFNFFLTIYILDYKNYNFVIRNCYYYLSFNCVFPC